MGGSDCSYVANTDFRNFLDRSVSFISNRRVDSAPSYREGRSGGPGDGAEGADQAGVGGEAVPGPLTGVHDVRRATKYRVGEPVAAQIVPDPLDRVAWC